MKKYLQAIQDYERNQKLYQRLQQYLSGGSMSLIKQFREGGVNLPSASLLKKLYQKYIDFCLLDRGLDDLFSKIVICAKLFYFKTINLSKNKTLSRKQFEKKFAIFIQPLGQKIINYLLAMRLRIKLILKNNHILVNTSNDKQKLKLVKSFSNQLVHRLSLSQIQHKSVIYYGYYSLFIIIFAAIIVLNYLLANLLSQEIRIMFDLFIFGILAIFAVITYPSNNFGKIDISGKNITAYRYKLFFNNLTQYIFTQRYFDQAGHKHEPALE